MNNVIIIDDGLEKSDTKAAPVLRLVSSVRRGEARLAVQVKAWVDWRLPPESVADEAARKAADTAIAVLAHKLQDDVARLLLTMIEIKSGN